jgi:hypothetical protein
VGVRLPQERLDRTEVVLPPKLGHVRDGPIAARDLEENRMIDPPIEVDRDPDRIGHDHEVGKDPEGSQEDVSLSRDNLDRTERPSKGLDGSIEPHQVRMTIA